MKTSEIRKRFLEYFRENGHQIVPGSPLVPQDDPTLLFTNAGMVPFKNYFLGQASPPYNALASAQPCIRAGGKHNDLENVGYTLRHHTFFEMLGNFSFGAYDKAKAIHLAWEFLTESLQLPATRLWVTVFEKDDETADIWLNTMKIDPARFTRCGARDNFWSMGPIGPCGPCTEIFYDHGPEIAGGPPGTAEADGDRYVEIWNLVFMEFERTEAEGPLIPLKTRCIDTGMGLERIASVLQGVHSNYDTDVFQALIVAQQEKIMTIVSAVAQKVIADHMRAIVFLMAEGIRPSNEGRGYVLRRILRRALRYAEGHSLVSLVPCVVQCMGQYYPHLRSEQSSVELALLQEEQLFSRTLAQGLRIFEQALPNLQNHHIPDALAFQLYDTYGFPFEITEDLARERGLSIDKAAFEALMEHQRRRSQAKHQFKAVQRLPVAGSSEFVGYQHRSVSTSIVTILQNGNTIDCLREGADGIIVLEKTPFYAESGGQIGDKGVLCSGDLNCFKVGDTQSQGAVILHYGHMQKGSLGIGDTILAIVDPERDSIMRHHSATHLLHAALQNVLGPSAAQKGSLVTSERLRFDFACTRPLTAVEIIEVERQVNAQILLNHPVTVTYMTLEAAKAKGALALFEGKYGDQVRVLSMGDFSTELCGGTHVRSTGTIGVFKITQQSGVAAGIRRVEAVAGEAALAWMQYLQEERQAMAALLQTEKDLIGAVQSLREQLSTSKKQYQALQKKYAATDSEHLMEKAITIANIHCIIAVVPESTPQVLRAMVDKAKANFQKTIVVLATEEKEKTFIVSGVSKSMSGKISAVQLLHYVTNRIQGSGGGRADLAQGGGPYHSELSQILSEIPEYIRQHLV